MRKWNFCAGPAVISEEVLKEVQSEILEFNESGMSVMEMSHRSDIYSEVAFNARYFHGFSEHPSQSEGDAFWELLSPHSDLEAVSEVNVHDLASVSLEHDIGRVSVAQPKNVTHHGHHCKTTCEAGPSL